GLARGRRLRIGTEPGRLLLEHRLQLVLGAPAKEAGDDPGRIGPVGLGDDADTLHSGSGVSAARAMSCSRSPAVRPVRVRWRKNSRLPLGPLSGDTVTPRACQPWSTQ